MSSKKIIVVTGATGTQGGSVANFLLKDGTFAVRAITRNPDSPAARELSARGATVVRADLGDPSTLHEALEGAYGVVHNVHVVWEEGVGANVERVQGRALVDAAKRAGIKHFIWSTLDHSEVKAPHCESKADIDDYLKASGLPRTSIYTSYYFENYLKVLPIVKRPDGQSEFCMPVIADAPFAVYSAADTGWVLHALKHPEDWIGRDMRIADDFLSYREMINIISDVTGTKVHINEVSAEAYGGLKNEAVPEEIHTNMTLLWKYNRPPSRDPQLAHELLPSMKTFRAWVTENHAGLTL